MARTMLLPLPTVERVFSADWMLLARVAPVALYVIAPVVTPLKVSVKVPPVIVPPKVSVWVEAHLHWRPA